MHPNKSFASPSDEHSFFKKVTETDLRKSISFILVKNILSQNPNKKMFRKNFLTFFMFFKFKGFKQSYRIEDKAKTCLIITIKGRSKQIYHNEKIKY